MLLYPVIQLKSHDLLARTVVRKPTELHRLTFVLRLRLDRLFGERINSQLDATITNFIDNYNQFNMFRGR